MRFRTSNPAFLVEGDLEQKFIQKICPGKPVKMIGCNGDGVSISAIAKRVGTHGRLLHKRYSPIVVVFDRERRDESCDQLRSDFLREMEQERIDAELIIGVADRDVENWILADFETFVKKSSSKTDETKYKWEGKKGKTILKDILGSRKYVETVDGVAWLSAAKAAVIQEN